MKKKKFGKKTAYSIVAGAIIASATFLPGCNRPTGVYGPPPDFSTTVETSITETTAPPIPSSQEPTSEATTPEYDTTDNIPVAVYGPPEDFTEIPVETTEFDPATNEPVDVYGPPEFFEDETAEPDVFNAKDNDTLPVYGPPADNYNEFSN